MRSSPQTALPVAPWIGGKRNLAKRICAIIDAHDHDTYAEPFVGMGGVFLRRATRPKSEFINDVNRDIHNLFRILQEHYTAFLDHLRFQITTQANFERLVAVDPDTLTDLQRAARFLYVQRLAFGGRPVRPTFGVQVDRSSRFDLTRLQPMLEALHERLAGVNVMNCGYGPFIERVDRERTFFYIDPPYWGSEDYYGKDLFSRGDFESLAEILNGARGSFLMSINDVPEIREIFASFQISEVTTTYTAGASHHGAGVRAAELLISNFETGV